MSAFRDEQKDNIRISARYLLEDVHRKHNLPLVYEDDDAVEELR